MTRTIAYIDGFNLYYRALRNTSHKWLDLFALAKASLPNSCSVERVNYYTARVSGRVNPQSPIKQHAYLRALDTIPEISTYFGAFMVTEIWAPLVQPPDFRPTATNSLSPTPVVARVIKTEEKGSDVNLGVHLVRDAFSGKFDAAAVLTNDTDLVEPIKIVTGELNKTVYLLTPVNRPAASLAQVATDVRHIGPYLGACQLPPVVIGKSGRSVSKPATW